MHDLTLHRTLKAPRSAVWACWTVPAHLPHWFCPKPHFVTQARIDLRPGGEFFTEMNVNGQLHANPGSILAVIPGTKLVFTDVMLADFQPVAAPGLGFTATITLGDHGTGTDYHVHLRHKDADSMQRHVEMGFHQGWGIATDQLEAHAATLAH